MTAKPSFTLGTEEEPTLPDRKLPRSWLGIAG
jgi:hypothetical protein